MLRVYDIEGRSEEQAVEQQQPYPKQVEEPKPQAPYPVQTESLYPKLEESESLRQEQPQYVQPQQPQLFNPLQTQQPPPYNLPGQPLYQQQNVGAPPVPTVITGLRRPYNKTEYGIAAAAFAIGTSICLCSFGCWWSLLCSLLGMLFGFLSTTTGSAKPESAKNKAIVSFVCTGLSLVCAAVGSIAFIATIVTLQIVLADDHKCNETIMDCNMN